MHIIIVKSESKKSSNYNLKSNSLRILQHGKINHIAKILVELNGPRVERLESKY